MGARLHGPPAEATRQCQRAMSFSNTSSWKPQFNHGWTRMDTDTRQLQKTSVHPEGEWKILSEIRVHPCSSVVYEFFGRLQLRNPG
jgi:hypothetical protein